MTVRHEIDLKGNGILTDSFDSRSLWKSHFGQYDPAYFTPGDRGDIASNDGVVSTISVGNAEIYGHVHTGPEGTVAIGQGWVGSHENWVPGGKYEEGWILHDANFTFPETGLPYSSGLDLGGPEDIVTMTYDYSQTTTNSASCPASAPWSGVITNIIVNTSPTYPDPTPAGLTTNTVSAQTTWEPAAGTYIGSYIKIGSWYYYQRITGYSWPTYTFTWNLYSTNAIYTTNHYDHVIRNPGDYYTEDALHGSTIVLGDARLVMPNGLTMSGNDQITIAPGGRLQMFVGGTECTIGGNGVMNLAGYAEDFILECTDSVTTFNFNGNGEFIGVLVGPNANMSMNGAGSVVNDFIGALMMNSITLNGHFKFHYDEALSQLLGYPPLIVSQPQNRVVTAGQPATFSVSATGSLPLDYQWRFAGTDIPNATNSSFTLVGATTNDAGIYSVIVTNAFGGTVSSNAVLTVNALPVLRIGQQDESVVISWTAASGEFLLQSADSLPAVSWDAVALDIVTNGPMATVVVPATNAHRYFRLQGN